jgi:hypothetical protein
VAIPFLSILLRFLRSALVVSIILVVTLACSDRKPVRSSPIAEKLLACQVLEEGQQGELTAALTGGDSSSAAIIAALLEVQYKAMGIDDSEWPITISWDTVGSSEAVARVEKFLDGLVACQVIDDQQRQIVQSQIVPKHLYHPAQVLIKLQYLAAYQAYIAPEAMLAFADSLHRVGIVSDDRYPALRDDIRAGKLTLHYQLLDYVEHGVHFDLAQMSGDAGQYLPAIYRRVADILPELAFTDFHSEIVTDERGSTPDHVAYNAVVSFRVNGIPYQHKSFIAPNHAGRRHGYLGYIDEQKFYQIFNQVLTDHRTPYRLHLVPAAMEFFSGNYQYFGIIALTQPQATAIDRGFSLFGIVHEESFEDALTTDEINQALHTFQQAGLLTHLTPAQVDSTVVQRPVKIEELLLSLPDVVFVFDTELANLEHPYEEILQSFARISHGAFHPTNIQDHFDLDDTHGEVTYQLAGKKYVRQFDIDGDWVDGDFLAYVLRLAAELKLAGRFYALPGDGQVAHFIYLTPPQALVLKEKYKLELE